MEDEVFAKLVTVERLLMILLSDRRYADLLNEARNDIHRDFGAELTKYFPSDPNYPAREHAVVKNFNWIADLIKIDHDHALPQ